MIETTATGAPSTPVRKIGRIGYSNSDAVSWNRETQDSTLRLRVSHARRAGGSYGSPGTTEYCCTADDRARELAVPTERPARISP